MRDYLAIATTDPALHIRAGWTADCLPRGIGLHVVQACGTGADTVNKFTVARETFDTFLRVMDQARLESILRHHRWELLGPWGTGIGGVLHAPVAPVDPGTHFAFVKAKAATMVSEPDPAALGLTGVPTGRHLIVINDTVDESGNNLHLDIVEVIDTGVPVNEPEPDWARILHDAGWRIFRDTDRHCIRSEQTILVYNPAETDPA